MNILALDISKARTGWAAGDASNPPRSGSVKLRGQTRGEVGCALARFLREKIQQETPGLVLIEAPLLMANRNASADTARMLLGLAMVAETTCAAAGAKVEDVAISSWRKAFLGSGRPENPKAAALAMCASLGWATGGENDRADALGVWAWGHMMRGEQKAVMRLLSRGGIFVRN